MGTLVNTIPFTIGRITQRNAMIFQFSIPNSFDQATPYGVDHYGNENSRKSIGKQFRQNRHTSFSDIRSSLKCPPILLHYNLAMSAIRASTSSWVVAQLVQKRTTVPWGVTPPSSK